MLSRKGLYYLTEDGRFMPLHYLKIMLAGCVVTILVASVAIFVSSTLNPEESAHRNSLHTLQKQIDALEEKLASLSASDHQLRLAVNLPVVSEEEKAMGTGGNRSSTLYADQKSSDRLLAITGKKIVIDHGFDYKTVYAHLSRSLVRKGQKVNRGDIIALSGNTGISTGPHLHYEVHKNNRKINSSAYFFDNFTPESFLTASPVSKQSDSNS